MRFPDLLVEVNKLAARVRGLEFEIKDVQRRLREVLPQADLYFSDPLRESPGSAVSRETEAQQEVPGQERLI